GDLAGGRTEDRDLAWRRQVEVERVQRPGELRRRPAEARAGQPEHADSPPLQLVVAVDPPEPQQDVGEHRVPRRDRVVDQLLLARDQLLASGGREEEAAVLVVAEELHREQSEAPRLLEPAQLAGGDVQLVEAVRDVGVVVEEARTARAPRATAPVQAALRGERSEQELAQRTALL